MVSFVLAKIDPSEKNLTCRMPALSTTVANCRVTLKGAQLESCVPATSSFEIRPSLPSPRLVACDDPICGASQKRKGETDDTLASVGSIRREIKFNLSFSWVVGKEILPQKKERRWSLRN